MFNLKHCVLGILLLFVPLTSQAVLLEDGDTLLFTAAGHTLGSSATGTTGFGAFAAELIPGPDLGITAMNGITIGTAQPTIPDIDQTWFAFFNGNHFTSTAITVTSGTTLDFSGWAMHLGSEDYLMGLNQGVATYSFDGTSFTLDYHWDAATHNSGIALGFVQLSVYDLHLEGSVSAVSAVPLPASAWLFGSALPVLLRIARRRSRDTCSRI